jgi:hypothetical protein
VIEILTVFLGLVIGPHPVELAVDPSVAAVNLRLDGAVAARLSERPWRVLVDFGPELVPHELEAVAIDAKGEIAGRVTREINRPKPEAEAVIFLEHGPRGRPVAARVTWETVVDLRPIETSVTLDGEPLEVASLDRFPLPSLADGGFHFLQVDLEFAGGISAHTQVVFGGDYVDRAESQLTAVPVVFTKGRARKPEELAGWFVRNGSPQPVVAVEKGPAEIIVVRSDSVRGVSSSLRDAGFGMGSSVVGASGGVSATEGSMPSGRGAAASASERNLKALSFGSEERLRLLLPRSREVRHEQATHRAFVVSPRITAKDGGLLWALTQDYTAPGLSPTERVADAVAVAGMRAAWGNRRRAVVLALAADRPDLSVLSAASVRGYLRTLDVPLFVWYFEPRDPSARGSSEAVLHGWPEAQRIASFQDLKNAVRDLKRSLDEQRVVWLEGSHAPESIHLAKGAQAQRAGA